VNFTFARRDHQDDDDVRRSSNLNFTLRLAESAENWFREWNLSSAGEKAKERVDAIYDAAEHNFTFHLNLAQRHFT
jgi:hypothetical protein